MPKTPTLLSIPGSLFLLFAMLIVMLFLPGCNQKEARDQAETANLDRTVGILKFVRHPALDDTENGIIDRIMGSTLADSLNIKLEQRVADGSAQTAASISELLIQRNVDITVGIATPAAQAIADIPSEIPLVYGAVSDPEGSGILKSNRATGIKNVGPSIILTAIEKVREWFPEAETIGTLYNPSEQNSVYVQNILSQIADSLGYSLIQVQIRQPSEVAAAVESLTQRSDVIYSANDNTFNASIEPAIEVSRSTNTPLILGDLSTLASGATAAIGLDYYEMGQQVGDIVLRILSGESPDTIPPSGPPPPSFWINMDAVTRIQVVVPESVLASADSILYSDS